MKKALLLLALLAMVAACSGPEVKPPDYSSYVWPRPPEKARVKLEKIIMTNLDIKGRSATGALFGEDLSWSMKKPHGIVADKAGNIYVSDAYGRKVYVLNLDSGSISELFNPYGWKMPFGIAIDELNGFVAVANGQNVVLFELASGQFVSLIGDRDDSENIVAAAFDPAARRIYVADSKKHRVLAYDYKGTRLFSVEKFAEERGHFGFPTSLAVDRDGLIYVVDSFNWRVVVLNPDGTLNSMFGEHGDRPGNFARPKGITISKEGMVLVTDSAFGNFQIFDKKGNAYMYVGGPGHAPGMFNIPQGIFVDDKDKVYVVDSVNRRIQIFQLMSDAYYDSLEHMKVTEPNVEATSKRK